MNKLRFVWPVMALVLLALGVLIGRWLPFAPGDDSPDVRFAREMNAHHEQAVEMALLMRERTTDENLKAMTLDIMLTQTNQMGQMQAWLASWGNSLFSREPLMGGNPQAMGMATRAQVNELRSLPLSEAETHFLRLMIRHHQGGVMMAEDALKSATQPQVRILAESIVQSQSAEIRTMESLLKTRGADPPKPLQPMTMPHGGMK